MEPMASSSGIKETLNNPKFNIVLSWASFVVGVVLYAISYYLCDEAFWYWSTETVTVENMTNWMIGVLLLPPGLLLWMSSLFRLSTHSGFHYVVNVLFLFSLVVVLIVVGAHYFVDWDIYEWLQWDFDIVSTGLVRTFQGVFLVLTLWLTALVAIPMMVRVVLQRNLYSAEGSTAGHSEATPLIGAEMEPINPADQVIVSEDAGDSGPGVVFEPLPESEREFADSVDRAVEYSGVFLFFVVFLPLFLWLNCLNVSDWHRMYPAMIIIQLMSTSSITEGDDWNVYFAFSCDNDGTTATCYARLYYDLLLWYIFVFATALFAYFTNKSPTMRIMLQKRVPIGVNLWFIDLVTVTAGEILFWFLWLTMMAFSGYYWFYVHVWACDPEMTVREISARFAGIEAIMFMTIGLFCTTRIRLWNDCFMVSNEHLVVYHKFFMAAMLITGYIHMILWLVFWDYGGETGNGPFHVPLQYNSDNFTPIVMYYVMIFVVPVVYIAGSFYVVRRKYFEWFYYLHLMGALIMIGSILWHATQSWRYITPPLVLYTIDRMIRLSHSSRICKVEALSVAVDGASNPNEIEVTTLGFSIGSFSLKDGEAAFEKLQFKMGQYVYINIANISLWEWHPFTVAAGEDEKTSYLQIQNEGECVSKTGVEGGGVFSSGQFTECLHSLARKMGSGEIGAHEIELHVDGPYGKPFVYDGYERVVLVAGGIGITPCHSIFSTMLSRSMRTDKEAAPLPAVDLLWTVRDKAMLSMFVQTLRRYEAHNPSANNRFSVRLFVTRPDGPADPDGGVEAVIGDIDQKEEYDASQNVVPQTEGMVFTVGRPDWSSVLGVGDDNDPSTTLVFACGPMGMVKAVENVAVAKGARFYAESFVF